MSSTRADRPARTGALFTQPVRQIVLMLLVSGLVAAGAWLIHGPVLQVFQSNIWLNGFIGFVFLIGVFACFWQVVQLVYSVSWIEGFVGQRAGHDVNAAPRLLAPLAALLGSRGARMEISATSGRSILESVATRIDEARDITRYLANLLIFLGLLGTFYGLATTVPAVVDTIRSLAPQDGETGVQVFDKLMKGLEAQLGGMGTAFSSSLLGLAGSLVVGLLELFASHGQNRFYRELEEWLSSITRIGLAAGDGDGAGDTGALAEVLDRILTRLDAAELQAAEDRQAVGSGLSALADGFRRLAERDTGAEALAAIAEGQARMAQAQEALLAQVARDAGLGADAEARMRLRSIDVQLLRVLEEISAGRQESIADLRADLGALTQAIRQLSRLGGGR